MWEKDTCVLKQSFILVDLRIKCQIINCNLVVYSPFDDDYWIHDDDELIQLNKFFYEFRIFNAV